MGLIVTVLVLALLAWVVFVFNRLVRLRNQWRTAWADIDVQLQRRHDLVPSLVTAVQAYAGHERSVLEAVTQLRAQAFTDVSVRRVEHPKRDRHCVCAPRLQSGSDAID